MLRLQARSIGMYFDRSELGSILVIENDLDSEKFADAFEKIVRPEYGALSESVRLVRALDLLGRHVRIHGWRLQQVLKLKACGLCQGDNVLILDAKNHFIRPAAARDYVAEDGRLRSFLVSQRGHLERYFLNSFEMLKADPELFLDAALPNITPFAVKRRTVFDLVRFIERGDSESIIDLFALDIAEFYLIQAFIVSRDGCLDKEYVFGPENLVTIFADKANDGALESVFYIADKPDVLAFGVHWEALPLLTREAKLRIARFWMSRGLVGNIESASAFLSPM